jgi:hypothetical protein
VVQLRRPRDRRVAARLGFNHRRGRTCVEGGEEHGETTTAQGVEAQRRSARRDGAAGAGRRHESVEAAARRAHLGGWRRGTRRSTVSGSVGRSGRNDRPLKARGFTTEFGRRMASTCPAPSNRRVRRWPWRH